MKNLLVVEAGERVHPLHTLLREDVAFLGERRLDRCRGSGNGGAGTRRLSLVEEGGERIDHREEDDVELLLRMHRVEQVVNVRDADLRREAGVDSAALRTFLVKLLVG